jgi:hypothetical protein
VSASGDLPTVVAAQNQSAALLLREARPGEPGCGEPGAADTLWQVAELYSQRNDRAEIARQTTIHAARIPASMASGAT